MRNCPLCSSPQREPLYSYTTTYAGAQTLYSCACAMIYASTNSADYVDSIYSAPGAIGSGTSPHDRERLKGIVEIVSRFCLPSALLLDVGCAQGGLLDAFRDSGFTNLTGLDPSQACVDATTARGLRAVRGFLNDIDSTYDFITLSHVLEHIDDVGDFLRSLLAHLTPTGRAYIEVPDASRYSDFGLPFLDFNSEHINHFSSLTLLKALEQSGFQSLGLGARTISLTSGALYPALYAVVERKPPALAMLRYIKASSGAFERADFLLEKSLKEHSAIAIYGAGEYLGHVLAMPSIQQRKVVQIVDRNPSLWGREIAGCLVAPPSALLPHLPIVIAAIVAEKSIRADIARAGLTNPVCGLEF